MDWAERVASRLGLDLASGRTTHDRVASSEEVKRVLLKAIEDAVDVYGDFVTPFARRHLRAVALRGPALDLNVIRAPAEIPRRLKLFFSLGALTYSFDATVREQRNGRVSVHTPDALDFGEQRHAPRWNVAAPGFRAPLLRPRADRRGGGCYQVRDLSQTGLSAVVPAGTNAFFPGQRISRLEISFEDESIPLPPVEIRNVTPLPDGSGHRIGIETGLDRRALRVRDLDFPLPASRPRRGSRRARAEARTGRRVNVVRYLDARDKRIVGILDTSFGDRAAGPVPVVVLPPATGRRKETLSALALTIIENFRTRGRDIAVLRFDGINRHGESAKDPEGRRPGMEMIHSTMGQAVADIHTTLDFLYSNGMFTPSQVAIVSMSSASIEARRALVEDGGERLHYWISLAGSPDFHDTLKNICGGLDLLGSYRNGVALGITPILGNPVDLDHFFKDAFERRLVYLRDALEEIPKVRVPVTWIYGRYDDWVKPERVKNLMSLRSESPREVISIPTGHQMRTSEEAMEAFRLVTAGLWKFFEGSTIRPFQPDPGMMAEVRDAEKARLATRQDLDPKNFWRDYLERKDRYLGFDIIRETTAYRDLMASQLELLGLSGGERILDAGCGTGNFVEMLFEKTLLARNPLPMPARVTLADYVPEALETARDKLGRVRRNAARCLPELEFRTVDLQCSRFLPVAEAMEGGGFVWSRLRGAVEGLPPGLLERLAGEDDETAIRVARGEDPDGSLAATLAATWGDEGAEILADLGRAARFLANALVPGDLRRPEGIDLGDPAVREKLTAESLVWKRLAFGSAGPVRPLPFEDGAFDRIISSLVVCYLYRPRATIAEFHRTLAPGGVLVLSSMKPDTDISRIYMRLIERLQSSEEVEIPEGLTREDLLNSARAFLNKAAGILNLEEDGAFEFQPKEDLIAMLRKAGFLNIRVVDSFGDPPQAYVLSGRRAP